MDFDIIKKNKPKLINDDILEKVIQHKKNIIDIKHEPTLINKIGTRVKNCIYDIIEQNILKIIFIMVIIILLTYRYFQYKSIKNSIKNKLLINNYPEQRQISPEKFNNKTSNKKINSIKSTSSTSIYSDKLINDVDISNNMYNTYNSNNLGNYELW